jgi:predicted nucleic acid-binding protein
MLGMRLSQRGLDVFTSEITCGPILYIKRKSRWANRLEFNQIQTGELKVRN